MTLIFTTGKFQIQEFGIHYMEKIRKEKFFHVVKSQNILRSSYETLFQQFTRGKNGVVV